MKTFILRICFFILFLTQFRVCVPSPSNFFPDHDNSASRGKFKEHDDTNEEEDFKGMLEGFGDIVDPDEYEWEDELIEEDEEEESEEEDDMDDQLEHPPPADTSGTSKKSGCSCTNESAMNVCECFGESVKSIPKNMTSVSRL